MPTSPTPWFLGEAQTDPGEWDWDGRIWSPPGKDDLDEQAAGGANAEPYSVAGCTHRPDAELIVRAVNAHAALVKACEAALERLGRHDGLPPDNPADARACERLRAALALARQGEGA